MDSLELPPAPSLAIDYNLWKKDVIVWSKLTSTDKIKRGRALQYSCRNHEKLHEAVLNIHDELVDCDEGLNNVLEIIDKILDKTQHQKTVEAYENFLNLEFKPTQNIEEFFFEFDKSVNALTSTGNVLSEDLLFYKLLKCLHLPDVEEKLVRATVTEFTSSELKQTLRRMYFMSSPTISDGTDEQYHQVQQDTKFPNRKRKKDQIVPNQVQQYSEFHEMTAKRSKRNPAHKCYEPNHWKPICNSVKFNTLGLSKETEFEAGEKGPISNITFINTSGPDLIKPIHKDFAKESWFLHTSTLDDKPIVSHFNEAVLVDISVFEKKYILHLVDSYSGFSHSTLINDIYMNNIFTSIENNWIKVFGKPCTLIFSNKAADTPNFLPENDSRLPILLLEGEWVSRDFYIHLTKFNEELSKILKNSACSLPVALSWANANINGTASTYKEAPALCAFGIIPLLPCVKGYKPPAFDSNQQYEKVLEGYFDVLMLHHNKRRMGSLICT